MKKMSWSKISMFVLVVSFAVAACSKPKDGTNGTNGTNGATGATGTANVIYSAWLSIPYTLAADSSAYLATITAPKLADSIVAKGEVLVYVNANTAASPAVTLLPYSYIDNSSGYLLYINAYFLTGKIELSADYDASTFTYNGSLAYQYRYIIIPGGIAGRSAIDWKNYAAVKQYLGLKD